MHLGVPVSASQSEKFYTAINASWSAAPGAASPREACNAKVPHDARNFSGGGVGEFVHSTAMQPGPDLQLPNARMLNSPPVPL
jgi:hypothetical protein